MGEFEKRAKKEMKVIGWVVGILLFVHGITSILFLNYLLRAE